MVSFFWFLCCHLPWVFSFVWLYCPLANYWCDVLGRYLQVEFSFFGKSFRVYCVYAPNRNPAQDQFFDDLHSKIDPSIPTVLCGDLNKVFDRSLDMLAVARPSSCMTALPCLNIFSRTILIFFQPPWLTLASRLIPRGTCHLLLRVISPPFARDILLWTRFCLLSVGWPDVRPLVLMALLWSSILSFGLFLVLILFLYSIPVLIPALSPSLSQHRGIISLSFKTDPVPSFWWFLCCQYAV